MTLLLMIFRKMVNTRWLMISWFIGLLITSALVASVPIFTDGIMQKLVMNDLRQQQTVGDVYPGSLYSSVSISNGAKGLKGLDSFQNYFYNTLPKQVRLPVLSTQTEFDTGGLTIGQVVPKTHKTIWSLNTVTVTAFSNLRPHAKLIAGKWASDTPHNGVYQVMIPQAAMANLNIAMDQVYALTPGSGTGSQVVYVEPVGVFTQKSYSDLYWRQPIENYDGNFVMSESLFRKLFMTPNQMWLSSANFFTAYDYQKILTPDVPRLENIPNEMHSATQNYISDSQVSTDFTVDDALMSFDYEHTQLSVMMWSLDVPVLLMLGVYMVMVTRLIVDRERNEIAVLRSRGASRIQIVLSYLIEVGLLSVAAAVLGPVIGLALTSVVGASSGFLQFVQRVGLPVYLSQAVFKYAIYALIACVVMVVGSVALATRKSIVSHKQEVARSTGMPAWEKYFIDVLLLLVSWYGWSNIQRGKLQLMQTQINIHNGLQIDPLSFFVPALFAIGLGLLCLRIYPWVVRGIYWLGRRVWSPSLYLTLVQVSRSSRQYQFLMVFLVMTISIGTFSASAARTINDNLIQRIQYQDGADITLQEQWPAAGTASSVHYEEPPYLPLTQLPGVVHAAQVFQKNGVQVKQGSSSVSGAQLMAVVPYDFAQTAWFRPNLLKYHWWAYLNLLTEAPGGCLVSTSLAHQLGLKVGQNINVHWNGVGTTQLIIEGIVKYWPTYNPYGSGSGLVVANLQYIQNAMGVQPYSVWFKLKPGSTPVFYKAIEKENIPLLSINNVQNDIVALKQSNFILGMNGTLTMGFLLALLVAFIGFLLYWLLTLSSRRLQFGIFRAMGMSLRRLVSVIFWEQLLTSGVACLLGSLIGIVTSRLFVSQFTLYFSKSSQVPPFEVVVDSTDTTHLYIFVAVMLVVGIGIIAWRLSRLRIHQAVKLGED